MLIGLYAIEKSNSIYQMLTNAWLIKATNEELHPMDNFIDWANKMLKISKLDETNEEACRRGFLMENAINEEDRKEIYQYYNLADIIKREQALGDQFNMPKESQTINEKGLFEENINKFIQGEYPKNSFKEGFETIEEKTNKIENSIQINPEIKNNSEKLHTGHDNLEKIDNLIKEAKKSPTPAQPLNKGKKGGNTKIPDEVINSQENLLSNLEEIETTEIEIPTKIPDKEVKVQTKEEILAEAIARYDAKEAKEATIAISRANIHKKDEAI